MTNLVPVNIQVPAHLANKVGVPSVLADSLGGGIGGGVDYPRISIKGARFRIIEGGTEAVLDATSLEVVIVGANPRLSKSFYATAWNPDAEASAPDCFTLDGVSPDQESTQPQNDLCATCPQNAWGSRVTAQGTKVKACADQKRLAIVAADDAGGSIYLLQVTPAALKGLNQYQKELGMRGIAPEIVRTKISFDTSASFPKLQFGFGGFISEDVQTAIEPLFGSDKVLEITGENKAAAPVTPAPEEAPPVEVVEEVAKTPAAETAPAEEVKTTGFGKATTSEKPASEEPAGEVKSTGFGKATSTDAAIPAEAPAETKEPEAAATAPVDATTAGLADEITALMEEVADDA